MKWQEITYFENEYGINEPCGDLLLVEDFDSRLFSDWDGTGYWAVEDKYSDIYIYGLDGKLTEKPDWATHIMWFNK